MKIIIKHEHKGWQGGFRWLFRRLRPCYLHAITANQILPPPVPVPPTLFSVQPTMLMNIYPSDSPQSLCCICNVICIMQRVLRLCLLPLCPPPPPPPVIPYDIAVYNAALCMCVCVCSQSQQWWSKTRSTGPSHVYCLIQHKGRTLNRDKWREYDGTHKLSIIAQKQLEYWNWPLL